MPRFERAILAAVLGLALTAAAAEAERKAVTVDDAVTMAVAHSRGLEAARARTDETRARTREVESSRLPALRFAGGYTRLSEVPPFTVSLPFLSSLPGSGTSSFVVSPVYFNAYSLRLSLQQPVFTGFRLKKAAEAARQMEQAAAEDGRTDKADVEASARTAYWSAYRAVELLALAEENKTRVEAHGKNVSQFLAQGLATRNDVLKVQAQLAAAELLRVEGRTAVQSSQVLLAGLLGLPLGTEFDLRTTGRDVVLGPGEGIENEAGLEGLLAGALAARPEKKSMDALVRAAEAGIDAARGGLLPQVYLGGSYYLMRPNPRLLPSQDKFYGTWDLGVTVAYDIWNGNQTGLQIRQAEARRTQAKAAREALDERIAVEVTQTWLAVGQARQKIAAADVAVLQAEENERVTTDRFGDGVALSSDVLDAELLVLQAKTSRTQALVELELLRARLRRSAGM